MPRRPVSRWCIPVLVMGLVHGCQHQSGRDMPAEEVRFSLYDPLDPCRIGEECTVIGDFGRLTSSGPGASDFLYTYDLDGETCVPVLATDETLASFDRLVADLDTELYDVSVTGTALPRASVGETEALMSCRGNDFVIQLRSVESSLVMYHFRE